MLTQQRPKTVPIVATFLFVATAIAVVVGSSLLFPGKLLDRLSEFNKPAMVVFRSWGRASGVFLLVLGASTLIAGIGLLRRRKWAWWFAMGLFAINGCGDVVSFIVTGDAVRSVSGILVCSVFLFLLSHSVRLFFRKLGDPHN
jgi:hypothetical protein